MNKLQDALNIADTHARRIKTATDYLENIVPFDAKKVENLTEEQLLYIDVLNFRFAKLQDLIGRKVINEFLTSKEEPIDNQSMIDKLNKLEKLEVIPSSKAWQEMIDTRNHISHEYPNHPELTARYINKLFALTPKLLEMLDSIKAKL